MDKELKNNKLVSIIIINLNGTKWINKCLSSLVKQTYKKIEIIIVDNNSHDDSIKYVNKDFPHVKIIKNNTNVGFSRAVNQGIKLAKGEYAVIMNNDTWIEKNFIEKLLKFYVENKFDVVAPTEKQYLRDKAFNRNTTIDLLCMPNFHIPRSKRRKMFYLSGVCLLFSKKLYLETLGFDNDYFMYFEDVDWFWRLNLMGKRYAYADKIFIHHAGAGSTGEGIQYNIFLWRNQNALQTILKNYSTANLLWILPFYVLQNLFEIVYFVLTLKFKIAYSYLQGWYFNIKYFQRTINKREWIQKHRIISDREIMKKMYWGSAKLVMLMDYIKI